MDRSHETRKTDNRCKCTHTHTTVVADDGNDEDEDADDAEVIHRCDAAFRQRPVTDDVAM